MYARYKHNFELEKYLEFFTEKKYKIALTQFRLSSHDLAIRLGRYENLNRRERVCKLCNSNLVETSTSFYYYVLFTESYDKNISNPIIVVGPRLINLMI